MRFLFNSLRRLCVAVLVIVLLACAVEVGLRLRQTGHSTRGGFGDEPGIPFQACRSTFLALPSAWYGMGVHAETGADLPLRVNSLGVRGPEYSTPRSGTLRILCLGDDLTLATGHTEEEAYAGRLATVLHAALGRETEVINAGLPAGCPLTEYVHYRRLLTGLGPEVVILHVDTSDARDDRAARPHARLNEAGEPVAVVHPSLDAPAGYLSGLSERFAVCAWLGGRCAERIAGHHQDTGYEAFQQRLLAWRNDSDSGQSSGVPLVLQPIAQLKSLLDERGIALVASTCPSAWQTSELLRPDSRNGGSNELIGAPANQLRQACRDWGIPCVDATAAVLAHSHPATLYLPDGSGLSAAGHALYATELARALTASPQPDQSAGEFPHSR